VIHRNPPRYDEDGDLVDEDEDDDDDDDDDEAITGSPIEDNPFEETKLECTYALVLRLVATCVDPE